MAEQVTVDAATMHAAAKDVRGAHTNVNGKLGSLRGSVDDLAAGWKGEASTQFGQVMERWDQDTKKLLTALSDIADLLDKSANTHTANEESQKQMINKYGSALNY